MAKIRILFRRFMMAMGFEAYRETTDITEPSDTIQRVKVSGTVKYRWRGRVRR